jgi:4-hydroxybenzoate polyprenyltransferase
VLDSITNATYTYGPFAMGVSLSGSLGFLNPNMVLFALVFSAAHAIGTIMDLEGDRKAGIRTFASVYGPRAAAFFAAIILLANLPFAYSTMKTMFAVVLAYALVSIYVLYSPTPENAKSAFKIMNAAIMLWFAYAALSILGFWPLY